MRFIFSAFVLVLVLISISYADSMTGALNNLYDALRLRAILVLFVGIPLLIIIAGAALFAFAHHKKDEKMKKASYLVMAFGALCLVLGIFIGPILIDWMISQFTTP